MREGKVISLCFVLHFQKQFYAAVCEILFWWEMYQKMNKHQENIDRHQEKIISIKAEIVLEPVL